MNTKIIGIPKPSLGLANETGYLDSIQVAAASEPANAIKIAEENGTLVSIVTKAFREGIPQFTLFLTAAKAANCFGSVVSMMISEKLIGKIMNQVEIESKDPEGPKPARRLLKDLIKPSIKAGCLFPLVSEMIELKKLAYMIAASDNESMLAIMRVMDKKEIDDKSFLMLQLMLKEASKSKSLGRIAQLVTKEESTAQLAKDMSTARLRVPIEMNSVMLTYPNNRKMDEIIKKIKNKPIIEEKKETMKITEEMTYDEMVQLKPYIGPTIEKVAFDKVLSFKKILRDQSATVKYDLKTGILEVRGDVPQETTLSLKALFPQEADKEKLVYIQGFTKFFREYSAFITYDPEAGVLTLKQEPLAYVLKGLKFYFKSEENQKEVDAATLKFKEGAPELLEKIVLAAKRANLLNEFLAAAKAANCDTKVAEMMKNLGLKASVVTKLFGFI